MKMVVTWDSDLRLSFSDSYVEDVIGYAIDRFNRLKDTELMNIDVTISSSIELLVYRLAVKEGRIKPEEIEFKFNDKIITVDKGGRLSHYPKGFGDLIDDLILKLL